MTLAKAVIMRPKLPTEDGMAVGDIQSNSPAHHIILFLKSQVSTLPIFSSPPTGEDGNQFDILNQLDITISYFLNILIRLVSEGESEDEILQSVSESEEVDVQEVVSALVIYGS